MSLTPELQDAIDNTCELALLRMEDLARAVAIWEAECVIPVTIKKSASRTALVATAVPAPPRLFAILCAEAIHHLASAFDHIAWALVSDATRQDPKVSKGVYMPIVLDEAKWERQLKEKLKGIDERHIPLVRQMQPFALAQQFKQPAADFDLAIMKQFDNFAKHRSHHVVSVMIDQPFSVVLSDDYNATDEVGVKHRVRDFEAGTTLLEVEVDQRYVASFVPATVCVYFKASYDMGINAYFGGHVGFPTQQMLRLTTST